MRQGGRGTLRAFGGRYTTLRRVLNYRCTESLMLGSKMFASIEKSDLTSEEKQEVYQKLVK